MFFNKKSCFFLESEGRTLSWRQKQHLSRRREVRNIQYLYHTVNEPQLYTRCAQFCSTRAVWRALYIVWTLWIPTKWRRVLVKGRVITGLLQRWSFLGKLSNDRRGYMRRHAMRQNLRGEHLICVQLRTCRDEKKDLQKMKRTRQSFWHFPCFRRSQKIFEPRIVIFNIYKCHVVTCYSQGQRCGTGTETVGTITLWLVEPEP
jgi:hypothetical protein